MDEKLAKFIGYPIGFLIATALSLITSIIIIGLISLTKLVEFTKYNVIGLTAALMILNASLYLHNKKGENNE